MCPYVSLFGLTLSTYGLCMAMAMMVSFGVIFYRVRQEHLDVNNLLIIFAFAFGFGLIGRWIRKPCAFPRPRRRRRGNVFWRKGRCRRAFGTRKKGSPGGPAVNRSRLSGVAQRQRRHSFFRLDAFVVVKVDITVNHFIGLGEGCRFVAVDTLCFENREMNFLPSHCHTGFQGAAPPGNVFCKRIGGRYCIFKRLLL